MESIGGWWFSIQEPPFLLAGKRHLFQAPFFVFTFLLSRLILCWSNRVLIFNPFLLFSSICCLPSCVSFGETSKRCQTSSSMLLRLHFWFRVFSKTLLIALLSSSWPAFSSSHSTWDLFLLGRNAGWCYLSSTTTDGLLTSWHFCEAPTTFPTPKSVAALTLLILSIYSPSFS